LATCFVIQPFDRSRFDKLYDDVFGAAITAAGLEPYRVDRDPAAAIPIQDIEAGIRRAEVCFAEITTDNPNVWFELGYAIAARKPVVLVCSEARERFPFDVQHRTIIRYRSESLSDFENLRTEITNRLSASLERQLELESISDLSPTTPTEGLTQHEIAALIIVAGQSAPLGDVITAYNLKQEMNRAGYTDVACALALRGLLRNALVEQDSTYDDRGDQYWGYRITDAGFAWLEENQDRIVLHRPEQKPYSKDDLPF
jgi:nucleoside 2-deoxyribosyltransferase